MKRDLSSQKLLIPSDNFIQQMHLLDRASDPELIFQLVIKWTKGQPLLTKKLLHYVLEFPQKIVEGQEAVTVERIVRNRLIKEFKQDELTLSIRKVLYGKDLFGLLKKTQGKITSRERIYLENSQRELGLSDSQVQIIEQYLQTYASTKAGIVRQPKQYAMVKSNNQNTADDSYQDLILLIEKSPLYPQLNAESAIVGRQNKLNWSSLLKKSWLLCLAIPLLLLLVKNWGRERDIQPIISSDISLAEGSCSNLDDNDSPRVSLGDKLLTEKHSYPETSTKAILYEATAAFSQCEYSTAKNKFQAALKVEKNNPEALIYLNNAEAMQSLMGETSALDSSYAPNSRFRQETPTARVEAQAKPASRPLGDDLPHSGLPKTSSAFPLAKTALPQEAVAKPYVKIAVSVPIGNRLEIAWEILRGVAQAQTEINRRGGIDGKSLLIEIVSDDNNPEVARQLAQRLAADLDVLAVVGHNDSNVSIAASDIYQEQELVMVSPTSTSSELSGIGSYIMRTTPSVSVLAKTLASYALIGSLERIAVCSDSSSSDSSSFAHKFTAEITAGGGQIVPVDCDFARTNFNPVPVVERAIALGADAILLSSSVDKISSAIGVAQVNQQRLPLLANHSLYTMETIETGQEAVTGMVLPTPWLPEISGNDFSKTSNKFWGGKVNWRTAMAYDATKAIARGLENADSRAELQSVLTESNFWLDGATGRFRFQQGDRLGKVQLAHVVESDRSADEYEFVKLEIESNNR